MNIAKINFKNQMVESYLRGVFKSPIGPIHITEHTHLGAYISRLVRTSNTPIDFSENDIALLIPDAKGARSLHRYFLYFTKVDIESIEKVAKTYFELDVMTAYNEGRELGLDFRHSVLALLEDLSFEGSKLNYEQIRRRVSREKEKKRKILMQYKNTYNYKSLIYKN